jgi:crotonobetainyl-CoA:carnitine CoA-transferase CaiB-like acyl-CoA transferase
MNTVQELIAHPQLASRGRWCEVDSPAGPVRMLKPPFNFDGMEAPMRPIPSIGEHTDAILSQLGIAPETVADWHARGIV